MSVVKIYEHEVHTMEFVLVCESWSLSHDMRLMKYYSLTMLQEVDVFLPRSVL